MFKAWPKTPRLYRDVVITEKIDGTNACVVVADPYQVYRVSPGDYRVAELEQFGEHRVSPSVATVFTERGPLMVWVQSRKSLITLDRDNFGFAAWVADNADTLVADLGQGRHYGEWWGHKIQRGYRRDDRSFSLFAAERWGEEPGFTTQGLEVVPTLSVGTMSDVLVSSALAYLREEGSVAAPGFMDPEGICVYHTASETAFKVTLKDDEAPKGARNGSA